MTSIEDKPIKDRDFFMDEEMSYITFSDLMKELTGGSFDYYYQDDVGHGGNENEKGYME